MKILIIYSAVIAVKNKQTNPSVAIQNSFHCNYYLKCISSNTPYLVNTAQFIQTLGKQKVNATLRWLILVKSTIKLLLLLKEKVI